MRSVMLSIIHCSIKFGVGIYLMNVCIIVQAFFNALKSLSGLYLCILCKYYIITITIYTE